MLRVIILGQHTFQIPNFCKEINLWKYLKIKRFQQENFKNFKIKKHKFPNLKKIKSKHEISYQHEKV